MGSPLPVVLFMGDFEHAFSNSPEISALSRRADLRIYDRALSGGELLTALGPAVGVVLMRDRTPFGSAQLVGLTQELLIPVPTSRIPNKLKFCGVFTGIRTLPPI